MAQPYCRAAIEARVRIDRTVEEETQAIRESDEASRARRTAEGVARLSAIYAAEKPKLPSAACGGQRCLAPALGRGLQAMITAWIGEGAPRLTAGQALTVLAAFDRSRTRSVVRVLAPSQLRLAEGNPS